MRLVKIGGSLLSRPNLLSDFHHWTTSQPTETWIVIVGGGKMIDAVRDWDRMRPSDPMLTHWWCVEMLRYSYAHLTAAVKQDERFTNSMFVVDRKSWVNGFETQVRREPGMTRWVWVNVESLYFPGCDDSLPNDWRTTTDAIAWWVAELIGAESCTLLKSCEVPYGLSIQQMVEGEIIDPACSTFLHSPVPLLVERLPAFS